LSPGLAGNPNAIILREVETAEDAAAAVLRSTAAAERAPWRIEYRSRSTYELWNDSATPKFYVGITGEGVRPKTVPRIEGHSSTSFHGLDAIDAGTQVDVTWHRREDQSDRPRRWSGNQLPKP
jgi:hypothetical protein